MALHKFTPLDRSRYRLWVGIDTGVHTGYAEWDRPKQQLTLVHTLGIHKVILWLHGTMLIPKEYIFVRIEDARLRTWIPRMPTASRERGRSEGAGSVKRDAKILEDFLLDEGIDFELVAPKHNATHVEADYFRQLTGYQKSTSKHSRAAAMLVYGY
jgi:hypothetical protein